MIDGLPGRPLTPPEARRVAARLLERVDVLDVVAIAEPHGRTLALVVVGPFDADGVAYDREAGGWRLADELLEDHADDLDEDLVEAGVIA